MERRYKVRLNSSEKIEELLQEIYDQTCKQINEINNNLNILKNSTNLGEDGITIEDKVKFSKAVHDYQTDQAKAIAMKLDVAKFMGEVLKFNGDANAALNDKNFTSTTKIDFKKLRDALAEDNSAGERQEVKTYQLR